MKKTRILKWNPVPIFTLLLVFLFKLFPLSLSAQKVTYTSNLHGYDIATSDTRLFASIYETDSTVNIKLRAIGLLKTDAVEFAFFYDPHVLTLIDNNGNKVTTFGMDYTGSRATLDPAFTSWALTSQHRQAGTLPLSTQSGNQYMNSVVYTIGSYGSITMPFLSVNDGKVHNIFECKFEKKNNGHSLVYDDFGIGAQAEFAFTGYYQPKFAYDGLSILYRDVAISQEYRIVNPDIFLYRSGQTLTTSGTLALGTTTATLEAIFTEGRIPDSNTILDSTGYATKGKGKLRQDIITQYGFIYTTSNVNISIDEFSGTLMVGNTAYAVPTATEIAAHTFVRGAHTFYIDIVADNAGVSQSKTYTTTLNGLSPNQTYYAWAYDHYYFQTSDIFQFVGNRITFETTDCIALNIGTIFTAQDPDCGSSNGAIQVYVTGGSGEYEYSVNGGAFNSYPNGLITGLAAGTYIITVRDTIQTTCPYATSNSIVLYNKDTDLQLSVIGNTVANCTSTNGVLTLSVTGGTPGYTYYLNGQNVTNSVTGGQLTGLTAGVYVVDVVDNAGCRVSSGEVRIIPATSNLLVTVQSKLNTLCGKDNGAITFAVTGVDYTYKLDGYPSVQQQGNDTITLSDLNAGDYILRVWDNCSEFVYPFSIINTDGALAFTATAHNEIINCDGTTTPGYITLNVVGSNGQVEVSIDGSIFTPLVNNTLSNLTNGVYQIRIKDGSACTYEASSVTVGREVHTPVQVGTIFAAVDPDCGQANGQIQVYATGGSGSYVYSVNGGAFQAYVGGLITGLAAGTYQITVKDAIDNSCGESISSSIVLYNANSNLQVDVVAEDATNCTVADGKLIVTVAGGSGNYTYYINGVVATGNNGEFVRAAGTYRVDVQDNVSGCMVGGGDVRINSKASNLAITAVTISNTACGLATGSISFKVTGFNNQYSYQLDGYPVVNTTTPNVITLNGIAAGVHNLHVWDGCAQKDTTFTVTNGNNALAFTATTTNEIITCDAQFIAGTIILHVTNGTSPYQYSINGNSWINFPTNNATVTMTQPNGVYQIKVKDATGCTYEVNSNIIIDREIHTPIQIGTIYAATDPDCGLSNGAIQVYATGGSGSYEYSVNGGTFNVYANGLINNLAAGTYQITVKDAVDNSCSGTTSGTIVLYSANSDLQVDITTKDASNCNIADGKIVVVVNGGTAPYDYYVNGVLATNVINGEIVRPAGVYSIDVKDQIGCVVGGGNVRISSATSPLAITSLTKVNTSCGMATGTVTFTVAGSTNYYYQLNGNPVVNKTDNNPISITGLFAGSHYLHVWDACGDLDTLFVISNAAGQLAVTATPQNEILDCAGNFNAGSVNLTVSGANGATQYSINGSTWTTFTSPYMISNLTNGIYCIEVRDASGCYYQMNNVIIDREIHTPVQIGTIYAAINPNCGQANGAIQVYANGGSGSYLYSVNGGTFNAYANGLITGLVAGTYQITVKDIHDTACGEVISGTIVLYNTNSSLQVDVIAENATNCTTVDGKLIISVSGGQSPYKYFINGIDKTNNVINGVIALAAGTYKVEVMDASTCIASGGEVRISSNASTLDIVALTVSHSQCGIQSGVVTFTVSGSSNYTYQLDGNAAINTTTVTTIINGLSAGTHYLHVWDGCAEIDTTFIITNGHNTLAATAIPQDETIDCDGNFNAGSIILNASNATGITEYSINGSVWTSFTSPYTISALNNGIYRIEVRDASGCTYKVHNVIIGHDIYTPLNIGTTFVAQEPTCGNANGQIQVYVSGGSGSYLYSVNGSTPTAYTNGLITNLSAGTYTITVLDANHQTCPVVISNTIVLNNGNTDLAITVTSTNATTCSSSDGALVVKATGGTPGYKYYIGTTQQYPNANGVINGLTSGTYIVVVEDASGCMASSAPVHINADASKLGVAITVVANSTCGSATGAVTFTVNNAAGNISYQLDGYATVTPSTNTVALNGLTAGIHSLSIWDGCGQIDTTFTISNGTNGLLFIATSQPETLDCDGTLIPGSIQLIVRSGSPDYAYSIDGSAYHNFPTGLNTVTINNVHSGFYHITVKDANDCTYEMNNVTVDRQIKHDANITAPVATTPQTFCSSATVANLQATGTGIQWYTTPTGGTALSSSTNLIDGTIYYAAQTYGFCESTVRTAVKVFIDNNIELQAPSIASPQTFCQYTAQGVVLTLADIATNGNTNIVWYATETSANVLPLSTPLVNNASYWAALTAGGSCVSALRTEVVVQIGTASPSTPDIATPQHFCDGAMIANIAVPNNQIVWYATATSTTPLSDTQLLEDGKTYYAAHKTGDCESAVRKPVTVYLDAPTAPTAPEKQGICDKATLADITITGSGIVWYDAATNGNILPSNTPLVVGASYWAAQSSVGCTGDRIEIIITDSCYTVYGTMFPFVHWNNPAIDSKFPVTVKLFNIPTGNGIAQFNTIKSNPTSAIRETLATYYDGSVFVPGTPKDPGVIGATNNPGLPIDWTLINKTAGIQSTDTVIAGEIPTPPVGMYKFDNLKPGFYILEISRGGYLTRWGVIEVTTDGKSLGHRELIAGDVNGDLTINAFDASVIKANESNTGQPSYNPDYDLEGNSSVDGNEIQIIQGNDGATIIIYNETKDWLSRP